MSTWPVLREGAVIFTRQVRNQKQQLRFFHSRQTTARAQQTSTSSPSPIINLFFRHASRPSVRHLFSRQRTTQRRLLSDKKSDITSSKDYNPTKNLGSPAPEQKSLTLSQRLKKLSREYGWSAVGVYFALSALDFPFCFLAVRMIGTDKIGAAEHAVVNFVKRAIPFQIPERWGGQGRLSKKLDEEIDGQVAGYDHGVREAEEQNKGDSASKSGRAALESDADSTPLEQCVLTGSGIGTQLALAYAIHKSFIFIRVPLTAAILPKVVKVLRGWGWNIGKRTPKTTSAVASSGR